MSNQDDSTFMPVTAEPHLFEYGIAGAAVLFLVGYIIGLIRLI